MAEKGAAVNGARAKAIVEVSPAEGKEPSGKEAARTAGDTPRHAGHPSDSAGAQLRDMTGTQGAPAQGQMRQWQTRAFLSLWVLKSL